MGVGWWVSSDFLAPVFLGIAPRFLVNEAGSGCVTSVCSGCWCSTFKLPAFGARGATVRKSVITEKVNLSVEVLLLLPTEVSGVAFFLGCFDGNLRVFLTSFCLVT